MIGKPKYKLEDRVAFKWDKNTTLVGTIYVVDKYGTFEYDKDVSYDIFVEKDEYSKIGGEGIVGCLCKHIPENKIIGYEIH